MKTHLPLLIVVLLPLNARAADDIKYNRDIRPILAENCFACHGPDSAARKAGLRLDRRDDAVQGDAIVPSKPDESLLIERILADDEGERMPPATTKKKLTPQQKDLLKRWIATGAEYQPHWSLIPPQRPPLPAVKNEKWVRNPIDRFILAELERRGLQPAPEADRNTLIRRLSLDLTGLPPTPDQLNRALKDESPEWYEHLVDRLLESPHWGEHRGRYWLDYARYADTHGIHFDNYREMWAYRDWVINAFNKNQPFDQFTIEQLAGDLLPNRTLDQQIATGFNRCNITSNEGGLIPEEYLVLYTRDRVETTAQVWLGLTAGCAVCHDHKFDPLPQKDFYSLAAFFNNTTQGAMDGNIKDTPPTVLVPTSEDRPRWESLSKELADLRKQSDERKKAARPEFAKWLAKAKGADLYAKVPHDGIVFQALLSEGAGDAVTVAVDGQQRQIVLDKPLAWQPGHVAPQAYKSKSDAVIVLDEVGDFDRTQHFSFGAWVRLPKGSITGAICARMDEGSAYRGWDFWLEGGRLTTHIIHKFPEDAIKVTARSAVPINQWVHLCVTYDGSGKAAGIKLYMNGVPQEFDAQFDTLKSTIRTPVPFKIAQRNNSARIDNLGVQDLRVYSRTLSPEEARQLATGSRAAWLASRPASKRTDPEKNDLFDWWLPGNDKPWQELTAKLDSLGKEEAAIRSRGTFTHVMAERNNEPVAYVLYRGEYDQRRDKLKPTTPKALPPMPNDFPKNRLGLAEWLLRPENPLTARVTVNRFWQEIFGTGIVRTSGDFGVAGELPTHPELLDWLAVDFRETNWDMKRFFKMLVMSAAYRQSAATTPEKLDKDPQNRCLSRGPRYRMDAEMIRDYALAASGILSHKIGGPSVKPYQPEGVWEAVAMIGSDTRDYKRDAGEKLHRRSMYTLWKRAAPPASMDIMNAPSRETCTVRRERTDTPLQALVTLNDPQFVEAARFLAEKALKQSANKPEACLDYIAQRLLARPFRHEERQIVLAGFNELLGNYQKSPEDAKKLLAVGEFKNDPALDTATLAAWTMVVNEVMNLDEVLNK